MLDELHLCVMEKILSCETLKELCNLHRVKVSQREELFSGMHEINTHLSRKLQLCIRNECEDILTVILKKVNVLNQLQVCVQNKIH